jgi:3',5'-cyclic AMP phosphodiesterase CpdA
MTVRVAQISDSHISDSKPAFLKNFDVVCEHLRAHRPDLVVNTGDLALDGADSEADLIAARDRHRALGIDTLLLPGNHDVGDSPEIARRQPLNAERLARYRSVIGADSFVHDVPGWRLIGINALLIGADLAEAAEQEEALRAALAGAGSRAIALFLHKPICDTSHHEEGRLSRFLSTQPRRQLLATFAHGMPALALCGHVHQYRDSVIDGIRHIWSPATSFMISDPWQPVYGAKTVGYLEHMFHSDGTHSHRLVAVRNLAHIDLVDVPEAYGDVRAWGPGNA